MRNIIISMSMSDEEVECLNELVEAVRAYYERGAGDVAVLGRIARETNRSSAIRDLLLSWKQGRTREMFPRDDLEVIRITTVDLKESLAITAEEILQHRDINQLTDEEANRLFEACTCDDPVDASDYEGGDPACPVHS